MNSLFPLYRVTAFFLLLSMLLPACQPATPPAPATPPSREQQLQQNLQTLRQIAQPGDLVTRLSDDMISQQAANMNETDKRYAHCGIVTERSGLKFVYHIAPNLPGADTIEMEPLDSFVNPDKHLRGALFRYQLSPAETDSLLRNIQAYRQQDVRFDPLYDLANDDKMYCSEMIAKALNKATGGRMHFKEIPVPPRMYKLLAIFFKQQKNAAEVIRKRTFLSPDNMYLRPDCRQLLQFELKIFPGQ